MSFRPEGEIPAALIFNGSLQGFLAVLGMTHCPFTLYLVNKVTGALSNRRLPVPVT